MFIEIENTVTNDRSVTSRRSGEQFFIREQKANLFTEASKYPDKFLINVSFTSNESERNASKPINPGRYLLTDDAFYINNNNQLNVNPARLKPLKAAE